MSVNREVKALVDEAVRQGWRVKTSKRGHIKLIPPTKAINMVVLPGTPSDYRSMKNIRSILRKSGLEV